MPRIKNMGTATMKFGEGAIVSGSTAHGNGYYSDYALVVTGSQYIDAEGGGGLTIFKKEPDTAFLRFINDDDPSSWYASFAFDQAENIYLSPGRSQDFFLKTRTNVSGDPQKFPFRIYDDGKAKFEHGQDNTSDAAAALPADVVFFVSGSGDDQNNAVFGGNLIVSGTITGRYDSLIPGTAIMFKNTETYFVSTDQDVATKTMASDENIFFSGSIGSKDTTVKGTAVFGGDVVVSGSFSAIQKHVVNLKYSATSDSNKRYVRFGSNGSNENPGVNNKFIPPVPGTLLQAVIRSTASPGNTTLGFHRATDGTEDIPTNAIETQSVNLSSDNTSAFVNFTPGANFGPGDIVGFSVDPTDNHGNVNITLVFELDFAS